MIFEEKPVAKSESRQVHYYPRKIFPQKLQILAILVIHEILFP